MLNSRKLVVALAVCVSTAACGPNGNPEKIAFLLDSNAGALLELTFVVDYGGGDFIGGDGGCTIGAAIDEQARAAAREVYLLGPGGTSSSTTSTTMPDVGGPTTTVGNVNTTFSFSSVINQARTQLTISIAQPNGIPAGATLAFCSFEADGEGNGTFSTFTTSCVLGNGNECVSPNTQAPVVESTTTTTTTTTTSTTTTTTTTTTLF